MNKQVNAEEKNVKDIRKQTIKFAFSPSSAQMQYPHLYGNQFVSLQTSEFVRICSQNHI